MDSHTPRDRRASENPSMGPTEPGTDRDLTARPSRTTVVPIVIAGLVLAAVVLVLLL